MQVQSASAVQEELGAHVSSAVLGPALELGLFWRLADAVDTSGVDRFSLSFLLNLDPDGVTPADLPPLGSAARWFSSDEEPIS